MRMIKLHVPDTGFEDFPIYVPVNARSAATKVSTLFVPTLKRNVSAMVLYLFKLRIDGLID